MRSRTTRSAHLAALALAVALTGLAGACTAQAGDSCVTAADCGRAPYYCESSMPNGYCTAADCERVGCPDSGICIVFEPTVSFCMAACEVDADCRDDYSCVTDFGEHGFCNSTPASSQ